MMKHALRFTLVEMLVVIAVIGILAGLLFPSLSSARAAGQKTKCLNNKRNLAQAAASYALNNDKLIMLFDGNNNKPYSWSLAGYSTSQKDPQKERPDGKVYLAFPSMRCPLGKVASDESVPEEKVAGMFNTGTPGANYKSGWWGKTPDGGNLTMAERFGKFRMDSSTHSSLKGKTVIYSTRLMLDTTHLALFTDVFNGGSSENFKGLWYTFSCDSANDSGYITFLHQKQTTIGYADGHADSKGIGELKESPYFFENFYDDSFNAIE